MANSSFCQFSSNVAMGAFFITKHDHHGVSLEKITNNQVGLNLRFNSFFLIEFSLKSKLGKNVKFPI